MIQILDDCEMEPLDRTCQTSSEQSINNRVVRRGEHAFQKLLPSPFRITFEQIDSANFVLVRVPGAQTFEVLPCIASGLVDFSNQYYVNTSARDCQQPRDSRAVAAVVSFATENDDRSLACVFSDQFSNTVRGGDRSIFHKG